MDVRILAATNADLRKLVEEGKFREDLYYRLNVINLQLPPLRERKEDIPPLVSHFFTKYCRENEKFLDGGNNSVLSFAPDAMQLLMEHNWPGNVRELENVVERAVVLAYDAGGADRRAAGASAAGQRHPPQPRQRRSAARRTLRCSRSWRISSGASSWRNWSNRTGARPTRRTR